MKNPMTELSGQQIDQLIAALDSLIDGDLAAEMLTLRGQCAVPYLADFLLKGQPRTISLPRCRAVRALGELGAYPTLISYFRGYVPPQDAMVLFAEDAVRSAAALELSRCKSEEVFQVLLEAARQRATGGLIRALGEYCRPESVPLLFAVFEDDLCREDAKAALRKNPAAARPYAMLLLRGQTQLTIEGAAALRRRRATLQLLSEFGIDESDWPELRSRLEDQDLDCMIAVMRIGFDAAPEMEKAVLLTALIQRSAKMNWSQEMECIELLDRYAEVAHTVAVKIAGDCRNRGEKPNWMSPFWRTLHHLLGDDLQRVH